MTKKGSKWALSCVATSAAVLSFIAVSNNTYADEANSNTQPAADVTTTETTNQNQTNNQGTNQTTTQNSGNNNQATNQNQVSTQSQTQTQNVSLRNYNRTTTQATTQAPTTNSTVTRQSPVTYSANADVQDGGNVEDDLPSNTNLLDYAAYFHIFANEATLNAHTNGNIAVGTLTGNVNFGTNIKEELLDKDISYIQNLNKIAQSSFVSAGNSRQNKVVFGDNVDLDVSNANRTNANGTDIDHLLKSETYQDKNGNTYIDFEKIFEILDIKSEQYSLMDPNVEVKASDFPDQNNRVIKLQDYQPNDQNQIVINLSKDVLTSNTPLTIYGLSKDADGTTVIINVDTEGDPDYTVTSQIKVVYNNNEDRPDPSDNSDEERPNQETEYFGDNHLLWNFYDSTASNKIYNGTINFDRPFQGSVLAPEATVNANANLDGNIVADKVNVNAETHRWDLQDSSDKKTEFEKPMTLPGELELPDENEDGGNEGIDPEEPVIPDESGNEDGNEDGGNTTDPETPTDPDENGNEDGNEDGGNTTDPETPTDPDENDNDEDGDSDSEDSNESDDNEEDSNGLLPGGSITNGSSENNSNLITGATDVNDSKTNNVKADNNKSTGNTFPQTGMKETGLISLLGVVLAAIVGVFGFKKRKDI